MTKINKSLIIFVSFLTFYSYNNLYAQFNNIGEGHLTKELIGEKLKAILGDDNWVFRENLYPTLKNFENDTVANLAATPAFFCVENDDNYDKYNDLRHHFEVVTKTTAQLNTIWHTSFGNANFLAEQATITSVGSDTLIAEIGNYRKLIPVNFADMQKCEFNLPEPDIFNLTLTVSPENAGTVSGSGEYEENEQVIIEAIANECYMFLNWTDENGDVFSTSQKDSFNITQNLELTANFEDTCTINPQTILTIRAPKRELVNPASKNYRIPIFITANENISNLTVDKLVIEIDRNVFYPRRIENNNGTMTTNLDYSTIQMIFEDVKVPNLLANQEVELLAIRGDVILADKDSSGILIDAVEFSEAFETKPDLINGFITLDICLIGDDRLLTTFDYSPGITVGENPVTDGTLDIKCQTIEEGNYKLKIVDILGNETIVKEWTVTASEKIFNYEIPVMHYSAGVYVILMETPTVNYSQKFIVQ